MERAMKGERVPETDSIEELAKFWDSHDVTDIEDQLDEVPEPVFRGQPGVKLSIRLNPEELERLRRLASQRGLEEAVLIREWVLEKLQQP
jgi:CopG antitoxin of type II toxin-antitoxin system